MSAPTQHAAASSSRPRLPEVEVCVVGSGAGGGTAAYALAKAGASVVVLEKGPWYRASDFVHDEIASVRRNMWVPYPSDEPHVLQREGGRAHKSPEGWIANCVGGGTVHMSGFFYRHHPDDFRQRSIYGPIEGAELADWPITYQALAPYYDEIEALIGISGAFKGHPFEPPRGKDFPLPPLDDSNLAPVLDAGLKKLGMHGFHTPRAVLSGPYRGRSGCVYCAFCGSFGCEAGAKSSTGATLIPMAIATGHCELRPHAMAYELLVDRKGRARGVRYIDEHGARQEQRARVVVVAATAVESARLLLASRSPGHPDGLGNAEGQVGRHLHFSALGKAWGAFDRATLPPLARDDDGLPFLGRSAQDSYRLRRAQPRAAGHAPLGYDKGGTLNFILPHKDPIYTAERLSQRARPRLWGEALNHAMQRYYHEQRELEVEVFGEFLANPGTRVSLDPEVRDRFGLPVARIQLALHPLSKAGIEAVTKRGEEVFKAAGAVATGIEHTGGVTTFLQGGSCRMGKDPKESVLNAAGQVHGVPGLYVTDGGALPTSGGVPLTFTLMANALRIARGLLINGRLTRTRDSGARTTR